MSRTEIKIMDGWEFALEKSETKEFKKISLPHDWTINAPFNKYMEQGDSQGYRDRWGIGWYKKTLFLEDKNPKHRYYLDFGGIFENSTIWVNEKNAGGHKYGYSSFRLDVTDFIRQGENIIDIKVDNTAIPADRWYSGAGIYRTVKWIETEETHFDEREIVIKTKLENTSARINIQTGLTEKVKAFLTDGINNYEALGKNGTIEFLIQSPKLWSSEQPNLYNLTLYLMDSERIADTVSMRIGIREIQFIAGVGMLVNGQQITIKGVCLHQDVGCRGIASKKEIWRERLTILKEMGCNAIRTAHHIFSTEFLDLCDEMGFYVYEEAFDKWTGGSYGRYFNSEWKNDIECMVKRDRNRPCIFIWGTGNEVEHQGQPSMLNILKMLKDYILTMDDSRPITYAMNPHFKKESNIDLSTIKDIQQFVDVEDEREIYNNEERVKRIKGISDIVDVISCNYQEQWYDLIHEYCPDKLILGTETYQFFKGHQDQMQNFVDENPSLVPFEKDYVIGSMIWTGYDYLGESMGYPSKGWSGATIRTNNEKRASYYILQSYWSDKPLVHFSVMDYSLPDEGVKEHWDIPIYVDHWHFPQFHRTVIPYIIASNCDEVALYINDKQIFISKPSESPNRVITGFLPYIRGIVKVIGFCNGIESCQYLTSTPEAAVKLQFDKEEQNIIAEKDYEILLTVRAKDETGNPYFRESTKVQFKAEGNAEILAVDNGDLMGNEQYNEDSIHMYHGCASVCIRLNGKPGRIKIFAFASGMHYAQSIINVY